MDQYEMLRDPVEAARQRALASARDLRGRMMHLYHEAPVRELQEAVATIVQTLEIRDTVVRRVAVAEAMKRLERAVRAVKALDLSM